MKRKSKTGEFDARKHGRQFDLRATATAGAHISDSCCDGLAIGGVGDGNTLAALAAVVLGRVDSDYVGRVTVDVATGTSITALG